MRIASVAKLRHLWLHNRVARDALIIAALIGPLLGTAVYFDLFDRFADFAWAHESWKIDEIAATIFFLGLGGFLFSIRRVLDLRAAEMAARRVAREDALTGLPNRRCFLEALSHWQTLLKQGEKCAVFVIDLDQFKPVNDLYGHRLGDEVLRAIATRLKDIAGERALVARIGGDEFGIILPIASDQDALGRVAERISKEVPQPIRLAALSVKVGVSVGISTCEAMVGQTDMLRTQDGGEVETILRQADMALYQAKAHGRGGYRLFERSMDDELRRRMELEREIKSAIHRGEIIPYYQPVVELKSGRLIGFEALARWEHPLHGLLQPQVLIPVAESTGTIGDMTYSLLRQALTDAATWPKELSLSINLSPRQFAEARLSEEILRILTEHSFPPHRLEIEITETSLIERMGDARATLESLRNLGVRIALDDFGAGYAGLYYLRALKLDRIKIDRSFVMDMLLNPDDEKIVAAIVSLAQSLGLQTTAEGVESLDVCNRLIELGCKAGQGYYFCKPKPIAEIRRYLTHMETEFRKAG
jgi:diguanylate cyclase (GGDEF)-like protein